MSLSNTTEFMARRFIRMGAVNSRWPQTGALTRILLWRNTPWPLSCWGNETQQNLRTPKPDGASWVVTCQCAGRSIVLAFVKLWASYPIERLKDRKVISALGFVTGSMTSDRIMEMSKHDRGGGCVHHGEQDAGKNEHTRHYVLASQACSLWPTSSSYDPNPKVSRIFHIALPPGD